jgi:hypothetical protein
MHYVVPLNEGFSLSCFSISNKLFGWIMLKLGVLLSFTVHGFSKSPYSFVERVMVIGGVLPSYDV